jgi:hypothetical protein
MSLLYNEYLRRNIKSFTRVKLIAEIKFLSGSHARLKRLSGGINIGK